MSFSRLEEEPTIFQVVLAWREGFPEIPRESRGVKGLGRVIGRYFTTSSGHISGPASGPQRESHGPALHSTECTFVLGTLRCLQVFLRTARHNQSPLRLDKPSDSLAYKECQRPSKSFWPSGRGFPRSLVSHVVLKVSAEGSGYFTTSSGSISGPMGHGTPRHWYTVSKHRDIGTSGRWYTQETGQPRYGHGPALHSTECTCHGRLPGVPT